VPPPSSPFVLGFRARARAREVAGAREEAHGCWRWRRERSRGAEALSFYMVRHLWDKNPSWGPSAGFFFSDQIFFCCASKNGFCFFGHQKMIICFFTGRHHLFDCFLAQMIICVDYLNIKMTSNVKSWTIKLYLSTKATSFI
jgi:hypothetical protein